MHGNEPSITPEGRRRSDSTSIHTARAETMDGRSVAGLSPINEAFQFAEDRHERLIHGIAQLEDAISRLFARVDDVIAPDRAESLPASPEGAVSHNEKHSTIARRVTQMAVATDEAGSRLNHSIYRLEHLLEAVQL